LGAGGRGMLLLLAELMDVDRTLSFDFLEIFLSLDMLCLDDFLIFFDFLRLGVSAEEEELDDPDIRAVVSVSVV
jgi:hypothetical protein